MALKLPAPVAEFATRLLEWYRRERRDLPWRSDPTPYRVWLSEVMLQQTQVKTVLPYFARFLKAYPTIRDLARAEESDVLPLWAGLGYYGRARKLLEAARRIDQDHNGTFPDDPAAVLGLPGIGRYTAGAVLSIAYGRPLPILDGNIRRLLSRCLKLDLEPARLDRALWQLLEETVRHPDVAPQISDFNQALMELGALVCTPRNPSCGRCPLETTCLARRAGVEDRLPLLSRPKRAAQSLDFVAAVIHSDGRYLMTETCGEPFPKGFWEFPRVPGRPRPGIEEAFHAFYGIDLEAGSPLAPVRHHITHHKLTFHPIPCRLREELSGPQWRWAAISEPRPPVSTYVKKIARRFPKTKTAS